jgi:hypothetical protein
LQPVLRASVNDGHFRRGWRGIVIAALTAALGALSACTAPSWMPIVGKKGPDAATPSCPVTAVLHPLANTVVFAPNTERKPLYVAWYGIFSDVSATCKITGDTLTASLDNIIVAERGPAARTDNNVNLSYFVALTAPDQSVLGKKTFAVAVAVPPDAKRGGVTDHVEVAFNIAGHPISDVNIMVGLQLSPDAVDYFRHYPGRGSGF